MTHPVCVVIPTIDSRRGFLTNRCLPSVQAAGPEQVVVVFGSQDGNTKRNAGARATMARYLLFVDDDCEVNRNILDRMVEALESDPGAEIAYSEHRVLREMDGVRYGNDISPGKWSVERLRERNYIDTTSLIRASAFPGFDPAIRRFQDWDLWLTMATRGARGVYVPYCLFDKFVIDDGISATVPEAEARQAIIRKHSLCL